MTQEEKSYSCKCPLEWDKTDVKDFVQEMCDSELSVSPNIDGKQLLRSTPSELCQRFELPGK